MNWNVTPQDTRNTAPVSVRPECDPSPAALRKAAAIYRENGRPRNADTCLDIAGKVERFGSYASAKQQDFARSLVGNATAFSAAPTPAGPAPVYRPMGSLPPRDTFRLDELHRVMQGLAKLRFEGLTISRKNGDTLCWILVDDVCVGKIADGACTLFRSRLAARAAEIEALLREINTDPVAAAIKYGKASGRCTVCGRDLTDETSVEAGIGPICAGRLR